MTALARVGGAKPDVERHDESALFAASFRSEKK
jgi:hypothetical protein